MSKFTLKSTYLAVIGGIVALATTIGLAVPKVALAEDCVQAWPSVTTTSATTISGLPGDTVTFSLRITNNDSVGCYASEFMADANDVPYDWSSTLTPQDMLVLGPQESADYSITVTSADWATDGTYDIVFNALQHYLDPVITDGYFAFSQHFTYKVAGSWQTDPIAPAVQIYSPTNGAVIKRGAAVVINAGAYDNMGVTGMTYSVNGVTLCSTVTPICSWQPTKKGAHTITVTARDSAGNVGSSSVTVNVR